MNIKISSFVASTTFLLLCSVSTAALADGMPFEAPKPQQILTPIDKSLGAATQQNTAQPASIVPPPAPAPAPAPPQTAVAPPPPPVPETRVVDVQPDTSFFGLSVGMYDPTRSSRSTSFNAEWQPNVKIVGYLQPLFGAMVTTKGAILGYGGIGVPFNVVDHVFVMPSLAVGAYRDGADYNLGRSIVERAGVELAYQFDDKSRLGLNFDVLTNGTSFQSGDRTEMVALTYTMPFNVFSSSGEPAATQMPAPLVSAPAATPAASASAPPPPAPVMMTPAVSTAKPLPHELP